MKVKVTVSDLVKDRLRERGLIVTELSDEELANDMIRITFTPYELVNDRLNDTEQALKAFKKRMKKYYRARTVYLKDLSDGPEIEVINNNIIKF